MLQQGGNMSLTTLFGRASSKPTVEKNVVSDMDELQEEEVWACIEGCAAPNAKASSGSLLPVIRSTSGGWNKKSSTSSLEIIPFTASQQLKEKKRPQGGLSILFGSSSTNSVVDQKANSDNFEEEFKEQLVSACIEGSSLDAKTAPFPETPSAIFQDSASVNIPGCWNNRPSITDAPQMGDEDWIPPHEYLRMKRLAYTGMPWSFSMCKGIGRTLKGRDALQFRDAVLRMTGFIEN